MEYDEGVSILPAFRKLVNVYWTIDKSEAFNMLQNSRPGSSTPPMMNKNELHLLQKRLHEIPIHSGAINDVQAADICVTRTWICAILWKTTTLHGAAPVLNDPFTSLMYPTQISKDFLEVISNLPTTSIEAHGSSMVKTFYQECASFLY